MLTLTHIVPFQAKDAGRAQYLRKLFGYEYLELHAMDDSVDEDELLEYVSSVLCEENRRSLYRWFGLSTAGNLHLSKFQYLYDFVGGGIKTNARDFTVRLLACREVGSPDLPLGDIRHFLYSVSADTIDLVRAHLESTQRKSIHIGKMREFTIRAMMMWAMRASNITPKRAIPAAFILQELQ